MDYNADLYILTTSEDGKNVYIKTLVKNFNKTQFSNSIAKIYMKLNGNNIPEYDQLKSLTDSEYVYMLDLRTFTVESISIYTSSMEKSTNTLKNFIISVLTENILASSQKDKINVIRKTKMITLDETLYWLYDYNCQINFNKTFVARDIKFSYHKINNNIVTSERIPQHYIDLNNDQVKFINPSNSGRYFPELDCEISSEELLEIYNILNYEEDVIFLKMLLVSKKYCHSGVYILTKVDLRRSQSINILYCLSYAMTTLYLEECVCLKYVTSDYRCVIKQETASHLPSCPYHTCGFKENPYLPLLLRGMYFTNIIQPVALSTLHENDTFIINNPNMYYGVCNTAKFKRRLNMFVSGYYDIDLFAGLDWSNIGITGSVIACCLPNFNPLMLNTTTTNFYKENYFTIEDDLFTTSYIDTYYQDSDIDIVFSCKYGTSKSYIDKIHHIRDVLEKNIKKNIVYDKEVEYDEDIIEVNVYYNTVNDTLKDKDNDIIYPKENTLQTKKAYKVINSKSNIVRMQLEAFVNVYVSEEYVSANFVDEDNTFEHVVENMTKVNSSSQDPLSRKVFNHIWSQYEIFVKQKLVDVKYLELSLMCKKENLRIYMSHYKNCNEHLAFIEKVKTHIESQYLSRPIEVFSVNKTLMSCVAQFHLPIVRAYYDGTECNIMPSCVFACNTLINIDYRSFVGKDDPVIIWLKYQKRGFGIVLNQIEKARYIEFLKNNRSYAKGFDESAFIDTEKFFSMYFYYDQLYKGSNTRAFIPIIRAKTKDEKLRKYIDSMGNLYPYSLGLML